MAVQRLSFETPGGRIRAMRLSKEMTQEALGAKVFATQEAVSQWENDVRVPSRATQAALADVLNTTRGFLFGYDS